MDKVSQERYNRSRERNDRISALMGQYMLRGYRMLGSVCEVCGTVLLKNLDQEDYCVACKEVDVVLDTQPPAATQGIFTLVASAEMTIVILHFYQFPI
ncbi:PREDICTED: Sjoegren syndrome/scleroderma autoantigen 1 homolog [Acropora digitifera]|uniref:Sjoegren syndrome/scleroderma autoantigen 1 homolog n=1 Tax=Acropora digitifera TaxID=70779 RepID=UPI00077A5A7A|nr:PREDICTED: Sjoegren syndrome/scleroderma autoantigen 1 homolog [Acropora digitifera]